ncbi:MAG: hypothetical protein CBD27_08260 [Rhodospirillaceae bacterium TMED167]|nr:hypothetical protein [Rhodospirillaceae bacterium]OUW26169.1 MAG: hypothetical protein CBD27_08260 [Rhodospirillaceae bacterium TMED167]
MKVCILRLLAVPWVTLAQILSITIKLIDIVGERDVTSIFTDKQIGETWLHEQTLTFGIHPKRRAP